MAEPTTLEQVSEAELWEGFRPWAVKNYGWASTTPIRSGSMMQHPLYKEWMKTEDYNNFVRNVVNQKATSFLEQQAPEEAGQPLTDVDKYLSFMEDIVDEAIGTMKVSSDYGEQFMAALVRGAASGADISKQPWYAQYTLAARAEDTDNIWAGLSGEETINPTYRKAVFDAFVGSFKSGLDAQAATKKAVADEKTFLFQREMQEVATAKQLKEYEDNYKAAIFAQNMTKITPKGDDLPPMESEGSVIDEMLSQFSGYNLGQFAKGKIGNLVDRFYEENPDARYEWWKTLHKQSISPAQTAEEERMGMEEELKKWRTLGTLPEQAPYVGSGLDRPVNRPMNTYEQLQTAAPSMISNLEGQLAQPLQYDLSAQEDYEQSKPLNTQDPLKAYLQGYAWESEFYKLPPRARGAYSGQYRPRAVWR